MKRLVGTAIGLALIVLLLCIPVFFYGSGKVDAELRRDLDQQLRRRLHVAKNGDLDVTETHHGQLPRSMASTGSSGSGTSSTPTRQRAPDAGGHLGDPRRQRRAVRAELGGPPPPADGQDRLRQHHARRRRAHLRHQVPHRRSARREQRDGHRQRRRHDVLLAAHPARLAADIDKSTLTVHLPVPAQADVKLRDRQRLRDRVHRRGRRDQGPHRHHRADRRPDPGHHRHGAGHEDPAGGQHVPWTGRWDRVLSTHLPLLVFVLLAARGGARLRLDPRRQVAGEAAGLPGPLRAAGRRRPGAGEVHLQRDGRPHDVRRHADVRRREGRRRPHPRPERLLDDHRQGRAAGLGRDSTRSPPTSPTSSAVRARRSPPARRTSRPGCGSRSEIARFDSSVASLGEDLRQHGQQRSRRLRWHAGAGRLRADAGLRDLEPVLHDRGRPGPRGLRDRRARP